MDSGALTVVAGMANLAGFYGEDVAAGGALFNAPRALALGRDGSLYVADTQNGRVRRLAPDGAGAISSSSSVSTLASGLTAPAGLAIDTFGNLIFTSATTVDVVATGADGIPGKGDARLTIYGAPPRDSFPSSVTRCQSGVGVLQDSSTLLVADACLGYLVRLRRQDLPTP